MLLLTANYKSGSEGVVWDGENARPGLFRDIAKYITAEAGASEEERAS